MKALILPMRLVVIAGLACFGDLAMDAAGQNPPTSTATSAVSEKAPSSQASAVRLLPNAGEVLKLARAKIDDDTIVAFVKSSKTAYNLNANEVVYLREQGVSDRVLTAMLEQQPPVSQTWAASAAPQQASPAASAPAVAQPSTTTTYVQPTPVSPPPTYAYPAPAYGYYDPYPCYGGFWGSFLPAISLSFGFGHGYHGGGYYHGGGHHH